MRTNFRAAAPWMVAAVCVLPALARADAVAVVEATPEPAPAAAVAPVAAFECGLDDIVDIVSEELLATARGGSDLHVNQNNLEAILEDNVASNLTTGDNTITEGAFTNTMGIPMVIQNSGNNVIIQNSTILNLELH